ncbi:MAG: DMT family transporter [Candidatus Atribacteria bacterium]|nr:DMT family transporter [Candidatus Atribacteria bacterium]
MNSGKKEITLGNPFFMLFLVSLIWGFNFSIIKNGVMAIGPLPFSLLRFLFSSMVMFFVLWKTEGNPFIQKEDIGYFIFLGFVGFGIYQPLWTFGLRLSLVSHSALILSVSPVVVTLIAWVKKEEMISWSNFLGVVIGFLGVLLIVRQGSGGNSLSHNIWKGDAITFVAAVCWGLYSYFGKNMVKKYSPLKTSTWSILFGTLMMFPISIWDVRKLTLASFSRTVNFSIFYGVVLSSLVAHIIWMNGVKKLGSSRTSSFQYVTQLVGVFGAWLFFREPLGWGFLVGMILISFGLWLCQRKGYVLKDSEFEPPTPE